MKDLNNSSELLREGVISVPCRVTYNSPWYFALGTKTTELLRPSNEVVELVVADQELFAQISPFAVNEDGDECSAIKFALYNELVEKGLV